MGPRCPPATMWPANPHYHIHALQPVKHTAHPTTALTHKDLAACIGGAEPPNLALRRAELPEPSCPA